MASELKVDKFTGVTTAGSILVTGEGNSTTTNLQQGLAKCWCHCNQGTPSIDDSLNSASLTDIGTGLSKINFTNSMANASFSAHHTHHDNLLNAAVGEFLAASFRLDSRNDAGSYSDQSNACGTVHGDLA